MCKNSIDCIRSKPKKKWFKMTENLCKCHLEIPSLATGNWGHEKNRKSKPDGERKAIPINTHANTGKTVSIICDYIKAGQNNDLHKWLPEQMKKKNRSKRETNHVRFELCCLRIEQLLCVVNKEFWYKQRDRRKKAQTVLMRTESKHCRLQLWMCIWVNENWT